MIGVPAEAVNATLVLTFYSEHHQRSFCMNTKVKRGLLALTCIALVVLAPRAYRRLKSLDWFGYEV